MHMLEVSLSHILGVGALLLLAGGGGRGFTAAGAGALPAAVVLPSGARMPMVGIGTASRLGRGKNTSAPPATST